MCIGHSLLTKKTHMTLGRQCRDVCISVNVLFLWLEAKYLF